MVSDFNTTWYSKVDARNLTPVPVLQETGGFWNFAAFCLFVFWPVVMLRLHDLGMGSSGTGTGQKQHLPCWSMPSESSSSSNMQTLVISTLGEHRSIQRESVARQHWLPSCNLETDGELSEGRRNPQFPHEPPLRYPETAVAVPVLGCAQ